MPLQTRFRSFIDQGHTKVKDVRGLTKRKIVCKYEVNSFTNKTVMGKVVDFTNFDHQGQGHSEVKVTQKYGMSEVSSKGRLCASMK